MISFISIYFFIACTVNTIANSGVQGVNNKYLGDIKFFNDKWQMMKLSEKYANQNVIIVVCSDICRPCIKELKVLNYLNKTNPKKYNFLFLSIGEVDKMKKLMKEKNLDAIDMFYDPEMSVLRQLNVVSIPLVVFLDEKHIVQNIVQGCVDWYSTKYQILLNSFSQESQDYLNNNEDAYSMQNVQRQIKDAPSAANKKIQKLVDRIDKIDDHSHDDENVYVIYYRKKVKK